MLLLQTVERGGKGLGAWKSSNMTRWVFLFFFFQWERRWVERDWVGLIREWGVKPLHPASVMTLHGRRSRMKQLVKNSLTKTTTTTPATTTTKKQQENKKKHQENKQTTQTTKQNKNCFKAVRSVCSKNSSFAGGRWIFADSDFLFISPRLTK